MNRPSTAVLSVFVAVVLIGGTNFVAVRFSNRELPPFWGAGLRFAIAGILLVGFAAWRRIRLPLGSAFPGVALLAVAMLCGAAFLLVVALLARETPVLPSRPEVWVAFLYLVTLGGIGLFIGVVFIVLRWTASASAYVTVLFPVVTVAVGAILAGELVSFQFVGGALLVMIGTYVGAFVWSACSGEPVSANLLSGASSQGST